MPSKLKSFELYGYKTFASRTEFKFADRVTAIIGPNGSGKSNIADALRWVLGEQSYSLLRGKKTEDMIFSGSENRSRAGMASATILFDNSDGWLPIDFSEVAIARRAYRDGQNEYLLNGQRVRLKDVSELLAQSGLAERTYTVIGQGLVDTALSLRAEERRRLFEEAAGIGLYRSRRDEAIKRLDSTHRNIERVQDILTELQPRLRSLERQAKRANEYDRVKADLRVHLLDWYGYHWHRTQREVAEARVEVRKQENELRKARDDQQELDEMITSFRDRIQRVRTRLAEKHSELSKIHARKEFVTREIAVITERIRSLRDAQLTAEGEISRNEEEQYLLEQRIRDTEDGMLHLNEEFYEARKQYEESKIKLENSQNQRSQIIARVERLKLKLTETLTQKANLDAHVSRLAELESQQKTNLENTLHAIEDLRIGLTELENRRKSLKQSHLEITSQKNISNGALLEFRRKIEDNQDEKERVDKKANSFLTELSRVEAQLDVLEQAENTFQGYSEGTKLLLKAVREKRISGAHGVLSSYLSIPENIETAISSVLGEYVNAFLLEDHKGVDQALEALENQSLRGILLPVDSLDPPVSNLSDLDMSSFASDEIVGIASDLIQAPNRFRRAVDLLLGHILIVKDRSVAKKVIEASNRHDQVNYQVVTLNGEVFFVHGPIISGSIGQTILSRPRRRKELNRELETFRRHLNDLDVMRAKLEKNITEFQLEEQSINKQVEKYTESENNLDQKLKQTEIEIEKNARNLEWYRSQQHLIKEVMSQQVHDLADIHSRLKDIEGILSEVKEKIKEEENSLQEIPIVEQQERVTYWNLRMAALERGISDQETRLSDLSSSNERLEITVDAINTRIEGFRNELSENEISMANLLAEEESIQIQIVDLQNNIEPLDDEVKSLEHELLNLQKNDVQTRQKLSSAENYHAQARIRYSQAQDKIERLRHRIEDDFGLVEYQYSKDVSGPTPLPLEGLVEKLPVLEELPIEIDEVIQRHRTQLHRIGPINPEAQIEYQEVSDRIKFLNDQLNDLNKAEVGIKEVISELDLLMEREFRKTFDEVAQEFRKNFTRLFGGGAARLELTAPDDMNETGIEIIARLPGRREQGLSLLSGGERSLTASALIFSLLKVSPPPFCILDEVDAMLDEANVGRFSDILKEISKQMQFIVVTHNRGTIQVADVLYGVTMGRDSTSQVISLKMEEVNEEYGV